MRTDYTIFQTTVAFMISIMSVEMVESVLPSFIVINKLFTLIMLLLFVLAMFDEWYVWIRKSENEMTIGSNEAVRLLGILVIISSSIEFGVHIGVIGLWTSYLIISFIIFRSERESKRIISSENLEGGGVMT